ncbi:MAG: DUF3127 domain-containing protein [Bacteroidia bacterium]
MDVTGIIKAKFDTVQVSEKFKKREFVLTIEPSSPYPQQVSFQLVQDKVSLIDNFNLGDEVKVFFNLKGREWTSPQGETKYFNTIDAWKLEKVGAGSGNPQSHSNTSVQNNADSSQSPVFTSNVADDDLPF